MAMMVPEMGRVKKIIKSPCDPISDWRMAGSASPNCGCSGFGTSIAEYVALPKHCPHMWRS